MSRPSERLLIQLGVGRIGATVIASVQRLADSWQRQLGIRVHYWALADSSGFIVPGAATHALSPETLACMVVARVSGQPLSTLPKRLRTEDWREALDRAVLVAGAPDRVIIADCAVGGGTTEMLLAARAMGMHVVLCNKDPLAGPYSQFRALQGDSLHGSLRLSATVGAGLPIASAVVAAAASGDPISELQAVASGSLGQICSAMSQGANFPDALRQAMAAGYCEPDPRVDLSGHDVARKLLILARLAGQEAGMRQIKVESLIPHDATSLSREAFLASLSTWRDYLRERFAQARATGNALRYVATMNANGDLRASLREISPYDALAQGRGPENVYVLRTEHYRRHPLVIAGPGAGVAVTAGAVVGDILRATGAL